MGERKCYQASLYIIVCLDICNRLLYLSISFCLSILSPYLSVCLSVYLSVWRLFDQEQHITSFVREEFFKFLTSYLKKVPIIIKPATYVNCKC